MNSGLGALGRALLVMGLISAALGALLLLSERFGGRLGRLPGDFAFGRGGFRFYFPLATSLILSAVLTLFFWLLGKNR